MATHQLDSARVLSSPWIHIIGGAIILGAAYLALREYDQGSCLYINWGAGNATGDARQFWFQTGAGLLFFAAFLWIGAAMGVAARNYVSTDGSRRAAAVLGAVFALALYGLIAAATWHIDPTKRNGDIRDDRYLSILWPIGLLQHRGNFSPTLCGE